MFNYKSLTLFVLLTGLVQNAIAQASLVLDIQEGGASGVPSFAEYAVSESLLTFTPLTLDEGVELWVSDGTVEGTSLLKDIWEGGLNSSYPTYPTVFNGNTFFIAEDAEHGTELWKTDGTSGGTSIVRDIIPGSESGAEVFFTVQDMHGSEALGYLFFGATNGNAGPELWKSDGTEAGTTMVKELVSGSGGASPNFFAELDGIVYFSGYGGTFPNDTGEELFRTDGTSAGTYLVKDVWPGSTSGVVRYLTVAGDKIYFSARTQAHGYELWVSDGTTDGTHLVSDIRTGSSGALDPAGLNTLALMPLGNKLVFTATRDFLKTSIWITDGTEAGTEMLYEFSGEEFFQANVLDWAELNGKLYFLLDELTDDEGLWVTDGTVGGTGKTANFSFLTNPVDAEMIAVDDHLVISADHPSNGEAVYKSDGTDAGTERIAQATQAIFYGITADNKLFFSAENNLGRELWIYDADSTSAIRVLDEIELNVYPNPTSSSLIIEGPVEKNIRDIVLQDIHGRIVTSWTGAGTHQLPAALPAGYYQLLLQINDQWYRHSLMISDKY